MTGPGMVFRSTGSAHRDCSVTAVELPALARQLLADDDVSGYRRLFERIDAIEEHQRRYWAGVSVLEQGLAARPSTTVGRLPALLVALATGALDLLEPNPSEPRLLSQAGVALFELWSLDAAEALFEAARRLDP